MTTRKDVVATVIVASLLSVGSLWARPLPQEEIPSVESPVVAEIQLEGAKLLFIDETFQGSFGLGILEEGAVNLAPFYERGASALEIFLAFSPEGTEVPPALYKAHELARALDPSVPAEPRADLLATGPGSAMAKAVVYSPFAQTTDICWGFGGVASYNAIVGNSAHDSGQAQDNFNWWSTISGFGVTDHEYLNQHGENAFQGYFTPEGHERAVSICVTHAVVTQPQNVLFCGWPGVSGGYNTVDYSVALSGQQGDQSWVVATVDLEGYGEGARYRSSSVAARSYLLLVIDFSTVSTICKERYEVFVRSKWSPPFGFGG